MRGGGVVDVRGGCEGWTDEGWMRGVDVRDVRGRFEGWM